MHLSVLFFGTLICPQHRTCRLNVSSLLGAFALNLYWRGSDSLSLVGLECMTRRPSIVSPQGLKAAAFIGHLSPYVRQSGKDNICIWRTSV